MSYLPPDPQVDQDTPPRALVEALRQEPIDGARIQQAYLRFVRERAAPARWRGPRIVRWAAVGVLVGVSSVYAATLIRPFVSSPALTDTSASLPVPSQVPQAGKSRAVRVATSPEADASPDSGASPEAEAEPEAQARPDAEASSTAVREQPSRNPPAVPSAEHWKRAARGLRDGDFQSANAALKELTRKGTEAERESALLVQAQVLLAQGKEGEARSLLRSLEASARAPSVRRKSAELLARLRDQPAQRSKARSETELP